MKVGIEHIGREREPLVVIDDFAADPDALRAFAFAAAFGPATHYYPGIRAPLPDDYLPIQLRGLESALAEAFGLAGEVEVIDASYSIVTTRAADLAVSQRLPHCDAHARNRIALIHYLSPDGGDGTAFFRHRSTGFETVDERRAALYADQLAAELRHGGPPPEAYIAGDTPLFERTMLAEARYNRALLYRSCLLHSGAIAPDALLSPDPAMGRLTITGFLSVGE